MTAIKHKDKKLGRYRKGVYPTKTKSTSPVRYIQAKYNGICASCGKIVEKGSYVRYHVELKKVKHAAC